MNSITEGTTWAPSHANRPSQVRNRALRVVPERVRFRVEPSDLSRDGGARFEEKFDRAYATGARQVIIELGEGVLSSSGLGVLLRARAEATREGIRFQVVPSCEGTMRFLDALGLATVLGAKAA